MNSFINDIFQHTQRTQPHRWRGIAPGALQQVLDYPDRPALAATWGAGQAHRVRGP